MLCKLPFIADVTSLHFIIDAIKRQIEVGYFLGVKDIRPKVHNYCIHTAFS